MKHLTLWGVFLVLFLPFLGYADPGPYFRFIQNKNQWPASVDFAARVPGGTMSLSAGRFSYTLLDHQRLDELHEKSYRGFQEVKTVAEVNQMIDGYTVNVDFIGANKTAKASPFGKQDAYYNFFVGNDSAHWASGVNAFDGMIYSSLYNGIDLKVYSVGRNLKYDFIVVPGADPSYIQIKYSGADQMYMDRGDLFIKTALGDLIEKKPVTYQIINGDRVLVASEFVLCDDELSFSFPEGYDPCYELIIDPLLIFSTYSGSTADNWGSTATPGENGTLYSAGVTIPLRTGDKFPATAGAFQTTNHGLYDIAILKYDSIGEHLLYASYLGGASNESPHSMVMNASQELIVMGTTSSSDFSVIPGAYDVSFNGGVRIDQFNEDIPLDFLNGSDLFISRISKDGTTLLSNTYLGGSNNDGLNVPNGSLAVNYGDQMRGDVITDADGNVYVSSVTSSSNFPIINGFGTTYGGGQSDALLLKMDPTLSHLLWSSYLGGSGADAAYTIKFDKSNTLFVAGGTTSSNTSYKQCI